MDNQTESGTKEFKQEITMGLDPSPDSVETSINRQFRRETSKKMLEFEDALKGFDAKVDNKIIDIDARVEGQGKWNAMREIDNNKRIVSIEVKQEQDITCLKLQIEALQKHNRELEHTIGILNNRILEIQRELDKSKPQKFERLSSTAIVSSPEGAREVGAGHPGHRYCDINSKDK